MNKRTLAVCSITLLMLLGIGMPAAAQNPPVAQTSSSSSTLVNTSGQATGFTLNVKLQNPLKVSTIGEAVRFFVTTIIKIAIPFIVLFFLYAGLKFILARGNPKKIEEARNMFFYTVIGTLLILGAWTLTNAIIGTVNSITS